MPVIEYMFTINENGRKEVPGYVADRGYHYNPADHTFLGWMNDDRDFWVPDTIETKTKAECVTRALAMHAVTPLQKFGETNQPDDMVDMTEEEVTTMMEEWYDQIAANNA